jgi:serine/threonine protein kinase
MLGGVQPFKGDNIKELKKNIISGKYCQLDNVSNEANNLIDGMLQIDPKKRLTISQILNHPWLFNVNVNNRFNINLFTNAEKLLLNKYNIDYLNNTKDDLVEIFSDKNLDTLEDDKKQIGNTKSLILAPYNSYALPNDYLIQKGICIENDICKFGGKAQQANLKYELNNNKDFDNGVIKTQKSKNDNLDNDDSDNVPNNSFSRGISPNIEFNDEYVAERKSKLNSPKNRSSSSDSNGKIIIKDDLVREIERNIGYDRKYLISCLKEKKINYATATYYLLDNDISNPFS